MDDATTREHLRLRTIEQLRALESIPDPALERIVRLAAALTGAPFAAIHVIDHAQQHRVASVGAPLDAWPRPDSLCRLVVEADDAVVTGDATADERFGYSTFVQGETPVRFYAAEPLRVGTNAPIGTLCVWDTDPRDADDLEFSLTDLAGMVVSHLESTRLVHVLSEAASTDSLTGLYNRRLLIDVLGLDLRDLAAGGPGVSVAVIDLDGFKAINDTRGHEAGDAVLAEIGRRLRSLTEQDEALTVARLGGDEFVVVRTGGADAAADAFARVAEEIERPIDLGGETVDVGASVGTAEAEPGDGPDDVLRRADLFMYAHKVRRRS